MTSSQGHWILTGGSGWFGRAALWEFEKLYGPETLRNQVLVFATSAKTIDFGSPHGPVLAFPLSDLDHVKLPCGLLHLAFLTRERVMLEGLQTYIQKNRAITAAVAALIKRYPTLPIITTSSGAAAALDGRAADLEGNPYATLKQEEENLWRQQAFQRMAVVFRVYGASGRFLKDPKLFALGDFIVQAKSGQPITVNSPRPVIRSYVHIGTLMRLAWMMLHQPLSTGYLQIDAVTDTLSLVELADCIARQWDLPPTRSKINQNLPPDHYAGDPEAFAKLLHAYELQSPALIDQILETATSLHVP